MTRGEAIEYFKFYRKIFCEDHLKICPKNSIAYQATLKEKEFYDMAIKALEQKSVLDKISAEIDELYSYVEFDEDLKSSFNMVRLEEVQRVIDKYKGESEGQAN